MLSRRPRAGLGLFSRTFPHVPAAPRSGAFHKKQTFTQISPLGPHFHTVTKTFTQIPNLVPHISNSIWRSKFNLGGGGVGWSDWCMTPPHPSLHSPHLPACHHIYPQFHHIYPQKSPLSPKFHQHLPKFHHIHHIYPHLPTFTHMWHHSAAPPNTDTLIKISETEIFTQCAGRVVSKLNPNFDLQISTVKLNLDPGTKFEICPKFSTRHSKLKFEGSKFILEGDH